MRLLDRIVQNRAPLLIARGATIVRLPGPSAYATAVANCPLRLVLTDPLTRVCTSLAYAEGDRLGDCLDLIHVPARALWVEWLDGPRLETVAAALGLGLAAGYSEQAALRAGIYVTADASGRRGCARTFWGPAAEDADVCLAPLVTEFDLGAEDEPVGSSADVYAGGTVRLAIADPGIASVLRCLRFRFDEAWAAYYRQACTTASLRDSVLRNSLAAVATDLPVLFALCLLLSSRTRLPERRPDFARLNRRRARAGRPALLEHVELSVPVMSAYSTAAGAAGDSRRAARLHHVRGHLVRRGSQVFWRVPHLRGRASFGHLRSRSLTLQFESRGRTLLDGRPADGHLAVSRGDHASSLPGGPP
jgi:hypothetical protein